MYLKSNVQKKDRTHGDQVGVGIRELTVQRIVLWGGGQKGRCSELLGGWLVVGGTGD
jgi:hypothetical protein